MPAPGARLGPYEITAKLGEGGMGSVWRATDTKLGREVALKLLPEDFADDPERHARFEREAKLLASLNHPNIAVLHALEHLEGQHALVMELVEGEGLDERMARGPIPLEEAIPIARQIAGALEAAHEHGIVHRDLKPANIRIRPDGTVKVLDFGLAKTWEAAEETGLTHSPTITRAHTAAGVILGTAAYMSPEQARGKPVDKRADIWAFGALLWEMLTGRRIFEGETVTDVLANVLKHEIDWPLLPEATPPEVGRLLRRCLVRDPRNRLHDIADARIVLDDVASERPGGAVQTEPISVPRARSFSRWAAAALVLSLGAALGLGVALMRAPRADGQVDYHLLTFQEGFIYSARFGPDGETIVYGEATGGRPVALYSTRADATSSRALDAPSADVVGISQNGQMALLLDRHYTGSWMRIGTLAQAALAGGSPRALLEGVYDADIAPDGASFAAVRSDGNEQRLEYPVGTVLFRTTGWISSPRISRDGRRVAFADHPVTGDDQGFVAVVEAGSEAQRLSEPLNYLHGVAWSADGREVVAAYGTSDQGSVVSAFEAGIPPRELLRSISNIRLHDVAPSGLILLSSDSVPVEIEGRLAQGPATLPYGNQFGATVDGISEDGTTVVGTQGGLLEAGEYQAYYQRGTSGPVSLGVGGGAGITPDGRYAFIYTLQRDRDKLRVAPTGPGTERICDLHGVELMVSSEDQVSCAGDGRTVAFLGRRAGEEPRGYVFDLEAGQPPRAVTPPGVRRVRISPDGRRLVAVSANSLPALYDVATGATTQVPNAIAGELVVAWSSGSDALFVWNRELPARVERLDLATARRELAFEWRPSGSAEALYGLLTATTDARYYLMRFRSGLSTLAVARLHP